MELSTLTAAELVGIFGAGAAAFSAIVGAVGVLVSKRLDAQKMQLDEQKANLEIQTQGLIRTEKVVTTLDVIIETLREELISTKKDLTESQTEMVDLRKELFSTQADACEAKNNNTFMQRELERAQRRVERHSQSLVNLDTRLTHALKVRDNALLHIHNRERWALQHWNGKRPETLPRIPEDLVPEIARLVNPLPHYPPLTESDFPLPMPDTGDDE